MDKVLTLTIPSYNVEKYLEKTLDSFIDEHILEDIEVLIVDDGSKDRTAEIGKSYEEKYPNTFRLISKENGGHGSTINRGIIEARGKYFKVVDGDDWVKTEEFVKLVQGLKETDAEFVVTNYSEVNDQTMEETLIDYPVFAGKDEWDFQEIADKEIIPMHPLVIRTDILKEHEIRMTEHCFYVDNEYTTFPIPYVNKVKYLPYNVYMYRLALATQSVSMKGFQNHIKDHSKVVISLLEFLKRCRKEGIPEYKLNYIAERTAITVGTQAGIYASFPLKANMKEEFISFDQMVKRADMQVYELSDSKGHVLHWLRKSGFKGYAFFTLLGKIRARF